MSELSPQAEVSDMELVPMWPCSCQFSKKRPGGAVRDPDIRVLPDEGGVAAEMDQAVARRPGGQVVPGVLPRAVDEAALPM